MSNTTNTTNTTITLTIELPNEIMVTPTTNGKQMKATVRMQYECEETLKRFLLFDLRRRAENMVRQDNARQDTYNCVVQGGKLQRTDKTSGLLAAIATERLKAVEALVASGRTREQAIRLLGYTEMLEDE